MNTIVKIFTGKFIDLTKIVSISDAYFMNRMGNGGYFVGFDIECQLLDKPIHFHRQLEYVTERGGDTTVMMTNGQLREAPRKSFLEQQNDKNILAVANLQKEINVIVRQWMATKNESFDQLMDQRQGTDGFTSGEKLNNQTQHLLNEHRDDIRKFLDENE